MAAQKRRTLHLQMAKVHQGRAFKATDYAYAPWALRRPDMRRRSDTCRGERAFEVSGPKVFWSVVPTGGADVQREVLCQEPNSPRSHHRRQDALAWLRGLPGFPDDSCVLTGALSFHVVFGRVSFESFWALKRCRKACQVYPISMSWRI